MCEGYRICASFPTTACMLTPEQHQAATFPLEKPLCIIAGAGTGKTRTLVHRILFALDHGVLPQHILAITFTKKSGEELQQRLLSCRSTLPLANKNNGVGLHASTFHSWCYHFLRRYSDRLGFSKEQWQVCEAKQARKIVTDALVACGYIEEKEKKKGKSLSAHSKERNKAEFLNCWRAIGTWRSHGERSSTLLEKVPREKYADVLRVYEQELKAKSMLDFEDFLRVSCELLEDNPDIRRETMTRHRIILVDEFQDSSAVQMRLLRALGAASGRVTVVGDMRQSIYGFRGSFPLVFQEWKDIFPSGTILNLTRNFRSTSNILNVSNALFQSDSQADHAPLVSAVGSGVTPRYLTVEDSVTEASLLCYEVQELLRQGQCQTVAILVRMRKQSSLIEMALSRANIAFRTSFSPIHNSLGWRLLAFFAMDALHWSRDTIADCSNETLLPILAIPGYAVAEKTLMALKVAAQLRQQSLYQHLQSLLPALRDSTASVPPQGAPTHRKVQGLLRLWEDLLGLRALIPQSAQSEATAFSLRGWMDSVWAVMVAAFKPPEGQGKRALVAEMEMEFEVGDGQDGQDEPPTEDAVASVEPWMSKLQGTLRMVVDDAEKSRSRKGESSCGQVSEVMQSLLHRLKPPSTAGGARFHHEVIISTIHAAKGLEYDAVLIPGLVYGTNPSLGPPQEVEEDEPTVSVDLQEEKRILYVAMTRAKRVLVLTAPLFDVRRREPLVSSPFVAPIVGALAQEGVNLARMESVAVAADTHPTPNVSSSSSSFSSPSTREGGEGRKADLQMNNVVKDGHQRREGSTALPPAIKRPWSETAPSAVSMPTPKRNAALPGSVAVTSNSISEYLGISEQEIAEVFGF
jgi:superfamily I DNA/RNA helicase